MPVGGRAQIHVFYVRRHFGNRIYVENRDALCFWTLWIHLVNRFIVLKNIFFILKGSETGSKTHQCVVFYDKSLNVGKMFIIDNTFYLEFGLIHQLCLLYLVKQSFDNILNSPLVCQQSSGQSVKLKIPRSPHSEC